MVLTVVNNQNVTLVPTLPSLPMDNFSLCYATIRRLSIMLKFTLPAV
jgi:hypothetical protein